jgi:hypothetical protein
VLEEEAKRLCQGVLGGAGLLPGQQQDSRWAEASCRHAKSSKGVAI